jgi:hypothetical protein
MKQPPTSCRIEPMKNDWNLIEVARALETAARWHAWAWAKPTTRDKLVMREQMLRVRGIVS